MVLLSRWNVGGEMKMSQELLSEQQQTAARLLAIGGMEKQQIADTVGICRSTLWAWEKKGILDSEVDRIKREFQSFGKQLMENKLLEAVNGYWDLIQKTNNDMVAKSGYEFFIERSLGKVSSKAEITVDAKDSLKINENEIKNVFDEIDTIDVDEIEE